MAGLAAVTSKIKLFASTAVLTLPPAIVARMATTIDSISGGRFGINIVSGWQKAEYDQMGMWPGDDYFGYRYDYSTEYVQVMKELWATGVSDFKGKHFQMDDCRMKPTAEGRDQDRRGRPEPRRHGVRGQIWRLQFRARQRLQHPESACRAQPASWSTRPRRPAATSAPTCCSW